MRQQRRRIPAVPPPTVRRRRPRRRRIQVLVQVGEAAAAHRTGRRRTLYRARQRVAPARIQDHQPQRRARCRYQQVVDRDRLEAHVHVAHREDLREATRKAAEKRRQQREQLSRFKRLKPGEKKHSKRMATVAAVYTTAPFVRSPEEFLQSLMP